MFGISHFISATISGLKPSKSSTGTSSPPSFHQFPSLPAELRRKIWLQALPERLIEASLDLQDAQWVCSFSKPQVTKIDHRSRLALFAVNAESREICLEQYIPFANSYVHPTLDLLYISWYRQDNPPNRQTPTQLYPVLGRPLDRLEAVAITQARNSRLDGRFEFLVTCLRDLGSPAELFLSLAGPTLPAIQSRKTGFSLSSGERVLLLDWPKQPDASQEQELAGDLSKRLRDAVMDALQDTKASISEFKVPKINKMVYYMSSGL